MLKFEDCRFDRSVERKVANAHLITAEGQALVVDNSIERGVKQSAGAVGEIFAGVSLSQQLSIEAFPNIETFVVDADLTVDLEFEPINGTLRLYDNTQDQLLAAGAPSTTADQYSIAGKTVTFHAGQEDSEIEAAYRYVPTTIQARTLQGDTLPGGAAGLTLNSVGVLVAGDIYTSEYDTSADWSANNLVVKLAAGGLFTIGGSGITVPNCRVLARPSVDSPFLGLAINNG